MPVTSSRHRVRSFKLAAGALLFAVLLPAFAQTAQKVFDIPTRQDVTQRLLVLSPPQPRAAVVLFAGGHGGLQVFSNGSMKWGDGNFLVRTRQLFQDQGLLVVVVDAPSDRQSPPFLQGLRQRPEHVQDIKAVIAWLRKTVSVPIWLVGTSRGTQSVAYVATELSGAEGPDGIVLSSTILTDNRGRPVPQMPLGNIHIPVLVVHHEQDGCSNCSFAGIPALMGLLSGAPRSKLISFNGGDSKGDPCEAFAYHGFNGIEQDVVQQMAAWILAK